MVVSKLKFVAKKFLLTKYLSMINMAFPTKELWMLPMLLFKMQILF
jgi:hypothetical protein